MDELRDGPPEANGAPARQALEDLVGGRPLELALEDLLNVSGDGSASLLSPPRELPVQPVGYVANLDHLGHVLDMSHVSHMLNGAPS